MIQIIGGVGSTITVKEMLHIRIDIVIFKGTFSSIPAKNRLTGKELIVIVQSRPYDFETRQSIRRTWGKFGKKNMN